VRIAGVSEPPNRHETFAGMRVMRIPDDDLKRLLLGSMSCVRRERYRSSNCTPSEAG
jgi:hypothetical protein